MKKGGRALVGELSELGTAAGVSVWMSDSDATSHHVSAPIAPPWGKMLIYVAFLANSVSFASNSGSMVSRISRSNSVP